MTVYFENCHFTVTELSPKLSLNKWEYRLISLTHWEESFL